MTEQTPPVLVGIDGTPSGLEALALGSAFAVLTGCPLILGAAYGYEVIAFDSGLVWPAKDEAQHWLEQAQSRVGDIIPWSTRTIVSTSPERGLVTLAKAEGARMIVLGSSRRGAIGRVLPGSTGRVVAHGAPCAVAIAPHDWRIQAPDVPLTFGVGFSDSPESRDALALAAEMASAGHAPLRVLTAVHIPSPAHPMFAATGTSFARWSREQHRIAEACAHEAVEALALQVKTDVIVTEGDPVERLVEASHDLDVLVVGSRRFGPLRSALLGSVSWPLIERAACPVVVVPRGMHAESFAETLAQA
jgi:nucleotide-binding universal stress UspA family protein